MVFLALNHTMKVASTSDLYRRKFLRSLWL